MPPGAGSCSSRGVTASPVRVRPVSRMPGRGDRAPARRWQLPGREEQEHEGDEEGHRGEDALGQRAGQLRRWERPRMRRGPGHRVGGGQLKKRDRHTLGEHDPADQVGRAADDQHTERGVGDRRHRGIQARDPVAELQVVPGDDDQGQLRERYQQRHGPQCRGDAPREPGGGGGLLRRACHALVLHARGRGESHARHPRDVACRKATMRAAIGVILPARQRAVALAPRRDGAGRRAGRPRTSARRTSRLSRPG